MELTENVEQLLSANFSPSHLEANTADIFSESDAILSSGIGEGMQGGYGLLSQLLQGPITALPYLPPAPDDQLELPSTPVRPRSPRAIAPFPFIPRSNQSPRRLIKQILSELPIEPSLAQESLTEEAPPPLTVFAPHLQAELSEETGREPESQEPRNTEQEAEDDGIPLIEEDATMPPNALPSSSTSPPTSLLAPFPQSSHMTEYYAAPHAHEELSSPLDLNLFGLAGPVNRQLLRLPHMEHEVDLPFPVPVNPFYDALAQESRPAIRAKRKNQGQFLKEAVVGGPQNIKNKKRNRNHRQAPEYQKLHWAI